MVAKTKADKSDLSCGVIPLRTGPGGAEYLLVQHRAGHWGFPKGHPKRGEESLATAVREFQEETGLTPRRVWAEHRFTERYLCQRKGQTVDKTVIYFLAVVDDAPVRLQPGELMAHAWLPFEAAVQRMSFEEGKWLLRAVHQTVGKAWHELAAPVATAGGANQDKGPK
jgi:bis(5'-nucleosidyl)-tetraphosphatase